MPTKSSARTATHPKTVAEMKEGLAVGNMLAGIRVVAGRKAPSWTSVSKDISGQILYPLEKVLGQVYKDKVLSSITSSCKCLSCLTLRGHFQTEWKEGGASEIVTS